MEEYHNQTPFTFHMGQRKICLYSERKKIDSLYKLYRLHTEAESYFYCPKKMTHQSLSSNINFELLKLKQKSCIFEKKICLLQKCAKDSFWLMLTFNSSDILSGIQNWRHSVLTGFRSVSQNLNILPFDVF